MVGTGNGWVVMFSSVFWLGSGGLVVGSDG